MVYEVKTLVNSSQTAGHKSIKWNDRNEPVSVRMYIYTIQSGEKDGAVLIASPLNAHTL